LSVILRANHPTRVVAPAPLHPGLSCARTVLPGWWRLPSAPWAILGANRPTRVVAPALCTLGYPGREPSHQSGGACPLHPGRSCARTVLPGWWRLPSAPWAILRANRPTRVVTPALRARRSL